MSRNVRSPFPKGSYPPLPEEIPLTMGERLKNRRTQCKLSQSELAKDICGKGYISRLEHNRHQHRKFEDILVHLAVRLDVSVRYLIEGIKN